MTAQEPRAGDRVPSYINIRKPALLLVEGKDEERFFGALLRSWRSTKLQVSGTAGKTKLRDRLELLRVSPKFNEVVKSIGIIRDADEDPDGAFQSVRGALKAAGFSVPSAQFAPAGSSPKVTVMIMPGNDRTGALEDLCLDTFKGEPARQCVDEYFECLKGKDVPLPGHLAKAKVQALIASYDKEVRLLGEAAEAGFWSWDHAALDQVKRFLREVAS